MDMDKEYWLRRKESILQDIDDWQSGNRATPGSPATGQNYPLRMRCEIAALEKELMEVNEKLI